MMSKRFIQRWVKTAVKAEQRKCSMDGLVVATRRGDTMIEVMFAVAIFGLLSVLTIATMTDALGRAEGNLEQTMAREEIEAQAEALRFIQSAAMNELTSGVKDGATSYQAIWNKIVEKAQLGYTTDGFQNLTECSATMNGDITGKSFVLNVYDTMALIGKTNIVVADTYPVVNGGKAYGIWINAKPSSSGTPQYYDFYIHTCFYTVRATTPTTLDSTVRLMNPSYTSKIDQQVSTPVMETPKTLSSISNMQEMTSTICSNSSSGESAALTDTRDNKTYAVRKLNGKCWMTQNLALGTSVALSSDNTNVAIMV